MIADNESSRSFTAPQATGSENATAPDIPVSEKSDAEESPAISEELWEVFGIECAELRVQWEQHASDLAETEQPLEELRGLMRCAHTLKGAAASMSLQQIAALMGSAEDFFEAHIDAQVIPPLPVLTRVATAFLQAIDDALSNHGTIQAHLRAKVDAVLQECLSEEQTSKPSINLDASQSANESAFLESRTDTDSADSAAPSQISSIGATSDTASHASQLSKPSKPVRPPARPPTTIHSYSAATHRTFDRWHERINGEPRQNRTRHRHDQ